MDDWGDVESIGMRKLSSDKTLKEAMETLKGKPKVKRTMWSRRAQEYEQKINSGDLIAIFSDGVTEAVNARGEYFGDERLVELLDSRRNPYFVPLAKLLLWETQLAMALEDWRARSGRALGEWLVGYEVALFSHWGALLVSAFLGVLGLRVRPETESLDWGHGMVVVALTCTFSACATAAPSAPINSTLNATGRVTPRRVSSPCSIPRVGLLQRRPVLTNRISGKLSTSKKLSLFSTGASSERSVLRLSTSTRISAWP